MPATVHAPGQTTCSSSVACYYLPGDIQTLYDFSAVAHANGGEGMTIGIVDAFSNTQTESDPAGFNSYFGLPACTVASGCLTFLNESGGTTLPGCRAPLATCQDWWLEQDLDVQWAHVMAPNAHIVVVAAGSSSFPDFEAAEAIAAANANVVGNSWGSPEFSGEAAQFDSLISGASVPELFSSGDQKADEDVDYPCTSPYAVCVGGANLLTTSHHLTARGDSLGRRHWGRSGRGVQHPGVSALLPKCVRHSLRRVPRSSGRGASCGSLHRCTALSRNEHRGHGRRLLLHSAGTSLASPLMAGFVAEVDTARVAASKAALGNNLNALLYEAVTGAMYHYRILDITGGTNNFYSAGTGWDRASGLGDPLGTGLSAYLVSNVP